MGREAYFFDYSRGRGVKLSFDGDAAQTRAVADFIETLGEKAAGLAFFSGFGMDPRICVGHRAFLDRNGVSVSLTEYDALSDLPAGIHASAPGTPEDERRIGSSECCEFYFRSDGSVAVDAVSYEDHCDVSRLIATSETTVQAFAGLVREIAAEMEQAASPAR